MKEKISAMMDGEADGREFASAFASLREPGDALETWRRYHLISDAMRDTQLTSSGFAERFAARLDAEPTVLAPAAAAHSAAQQAVVERPRWFALSAAASVAAVALVGWVALAPQPGTDAALVAKSQPPGQPAAAAAVTAMPAREPATLPLTNAADDYLLAHQAYSPRNGFQGVAPYVRTVATRTERGR